MTTLTLTSKEQLILKRLPAALFARCNIALEEGTFTDTPEFQEKRFKTNSISDPNLRLLLKNVQVAKSEQELADAIKQVDLGSIPGRDVAEFCYVVGPTVLSEMIFQKLTEATSKEDIEFIAGLSFVRHAFYESFASPQQS